MADGSNDRPQEEPRAGNPLGGNRSGGWLHKLIGDEEDRKPRLIGLIGVLVVLLILFLYAMINHRATERKNLGVIAAVAEQNTPIARLAVVKQEVVEGVVSTHLRWSEIAPSGAEGNVLELQVPGDTLHVGVGQTTVTHRKLDDPLELVYFEQLSGSEGEQQGLIEDKGPYYYRFQGDRSASVGRTAKRLWAVLTEERPAPSYLDVETRALGGLDVALLLGEQWELTLGPTGVVDPRLVRSPRDDFGRFDLGAAVQTTNKLEVKLEEVLRQVEYAEQLDPDLVYYRVAVRLTNTGEEPLTIDPNLFQLQDDAGQVFRPGLTSRVELGPGRGQTARLHFKAPPTVTGMRFTIPGETVAGGDGTQPLVIFLQRDDAYLGDVLPVGDFLVSLDHVERKVVEGDFVIVVNLTVANLTWETATLRTKQFFLEALHYDNAESIEASELSIAEIEPYFPEQVAVSFSVGPELERADPQLRFESLRKKVVHTNAVFNLAPLDDVDPYAGRHYAQQVCAAQQYRRFHELMFGGPRGVLGLLSDKKAREKEALRHLDLAGSFYPESTVIATAAP